MSTANKVFLRCLFATFCSLLLLGRTSPVDAGILFSDDFTRPDSAAVGNGWTEVDGGNLNSSIASNALKMSQTGGLSADPNDGQDTRIYRIGTQHDNIVLSGTLNISMSGPGGAQQVARVVVRSDGTAGTGDPLQIPCGVGGTTPPNCWQGDGYGFSAWADTIDLDGSRRLQIVDNGIELVGAFFPFVNGQTVQWEMEINELNHIALFMWTGTKPAVPTVEFTNGGNPYTPVASGNFWQIEVKNTNDHIGSSHAHTALWDDFQVASLTPTYSCVGFDPPMDNGAVTVKKNRVLPLKAELFDENGDPVSNVDVSAPPVIQVFFESGIAPAVDVTDQALSAGQGTDGNQFEFSDGKWRFNLQTKNYTAAGTYTITMVSGDDSEYTIDPTCIAEFVIE